MIEKLLKAGTTVTDWGGMESARVKYHASPQSTEELQILVKYAADHKLKVTLRGIGHSAGGQSFSDDVLMIDIRGLKQVLHFDPKARMITVQTGADWTVLTKLLEPHRLCVTTKQEFDTFTVGGSLAVNVHGKSVDYGPLIDHIESFRLLTADGRLLSVSRTEHSNLFVSAIGGYGLLGIIVDVTLRLVADRIVEKSEIVRMQRKALIPAYLSRVQRQPAPPLCYGFLNATCEHGFYVTYDYAIEELQETSQDLKRDETSPFLFNLLILAQRWSRRLRRRGVDLMWATGGKAEKTLRSRRLLLWDKAPRAFQGMLLQKYFVPADRFDEFAVRVGEVFREFEDRISILMHHFRFVPANNECLMSFAPTDSVCMIPCYLARKGSESWKRDMEAVTSRLLNIAVELGGRYYLTFDILGSVEIFRQAYPRWMEFREAKQTVDQSGMFTSRFWEKYFL